MDEKVWRARLKKFKPGKRAALEIPEDRDPKVCATTDCPWCPATWEGYRVQCPRCLCCASCGLVCDGAFKCNLCGNNLPAKMRDYSQRKSIKLA